MLDVLMTHWHTLLAESEWELHDLTEQVNRNRAEYGLDIIRKMITIIISIEKERATIDITVNGETLELVTCFLYLGHITNDSISETEIKKKDNRNGYKSI